MAKWSGLAPAVNAHLARWQKVDQEYKKLNRVRDRASDRASVPSSQFPVAGNWGIFARSWGLPQADGSVTTPTVITEGATINGREQFQMNQASESNGFILMERERQILHDAETVYIASDIIDRITYAAQDLEPEPLFYTDVFAPVGLAILEKPLLIPDYHPRSGVLTDYLHVAMRAISWGPCTVHGEDSEGNHNPHPGIMMMSYTTNDDWRQTYHADLVKAVRSGQIDPIAAGMMLKGDEVSDIIDLHFSMASNLGRDMLAPMDVMPWAFGRQWQHRPHTTYEPGTIDSAVAYVRRWFLTLMRFCWQRILVPDHPEMSRKLAKSVVLFKRPTNQYSVLRLRRTQEKSEATGTGAALTYRQKVRGYWMRAYCSTLGPSRLEDGAWNDESHRLVWVPPGWRGPETGEIGALHKATVVVR